MRASNFAVNVLTDAADAAVGDGLCDSDAGLEGEQCSLRAAVQEANASGGRCRIQLGEGVHALSLAGTAEDAAATGDLDIVADAQVEIRGRGEAGPIDAGGLDRVFDVHAGGQLSLSEVMLTGGATPAGEAGGGIRNAGVLTLRSSIVADHTAGAPGTGVGGGIHNSGDLTLTGSTVRDNTASARGGGLYHTGAGRAEVNRSLFVGNRADGVAAGDGGGGIFNDAGTLNVSKTEFEQNGAARAGGGIEANAGTTNLDRVTMRANTAGPSPGNGGGFHQTGSGSVNVLRGLYEGNSAAAEGGGLWNGTGTMVIVGARVSGNAASGDAADNGGGGVFNAGGDLMLERSRLEGNAADGLLGSGGGILNDSGTLIVVKSRLEANTASRAGGGIEANGGETSLERVWLRDNETGPNPGNGGGLHVTGSGEAEIRSSQLRDNMAAEEGGGLWNGTGTLTLIRTQLRGNVAGGAAADSGGGGVFNAGGSLIVRERSRIRGNRAEAGSGGGILNDMGDLSVSDTTIDRNTAAQAGGGIEVVGGASEEIGGADLVRVKLEANETGPNPGDGGGLHLTDHSRVTIDASSISRNVAAGAGGGLWNSAEGTMTVTTTRLDKNSAPEADDGTDAFNAGGTLTIDGQDVDGAFPTP